MRKNSNIIRAFDALTIVKGINSLGGPDKQVYYIESDVYAPDRRITPLLLQPYVNVSDPNGIITAGDKVSELVDGAWYVDAIDPKNRVTKSSAGSTLDDPFTIGDNHRLMVRLNTDKSVMLFFEGDYYDSRKGSKIHISLSYMLSTTHNSQNKPAPKVLLSKGASYTYNPLDDLTELIIESQLADDGKLLRGAVEWCEVEGTKITAISDAMPYYISGQHSDKLKINPSLMGDVVIRARNPSEEFYNKVYGINPDWDSKMQEVFENRNLYSLKNKHIINYYMRDDVLRKAPDSSTCIYFKIDRAGRYTCSISIEVPIFRVAYSDEDILSGEDLYSLKSVNLAENIFTKTIDVPASAKFIVIQISADKINEALEKLKLERGDKSTPYTPAPEDLNWENLLSLTTWAQKAPSEDLPVNNYVYRPFKIKPSFYNNELYYFMANVEVLKGNPKEVTVKFNPNSPWINIPIKDNVIKSVVHRLPNNSADFLVYQGGSGETKGNSIRFYNAVLIDANIEIDKYIPIPEDYAPDGIIKGTYQSDMKFTPLYPNIEANVVYLTTPVIKKGVERIKAQAVLSTNKKTITNPEKHFDLKWILKPTTAGGSETVVGTGEFVDIPVANLPEGRVIGLDLDYNFKKQ